MRDGSTDRTPMEMHVLDTLKAAPPPTDADPPGHPRCSASALELGAASRGTLMGPQALRTAGLGRACSPSSATASATAARCTRSRR